MQQAKENGSLAHANDQAQMRMDPLDKPDWRLAVSDAVRAPSSHNSQPWLFRETQHGIVLLADFTRCLSVVDPLDRELFISCGAALEQLLLSLHMQGFAYEVTINDNSASAEVAEITIVGRIEPSATESLLHAAIPLRQTSRVAFEMMPLPRELKSDLQLAAACRDTRLMLVEDTGEQEFLVDVIMQADRQQSANREFRRELSAWLRPNRAHSNDGMYASLSGLKDISSYVAPFLIRTFDFGDKRAAQDHQLVAASALLAVLSSEVDNKQSWIETGQALSRVALTTAAAGFSMSYLNQPVEIASLRSDLQKQMQEQGVPQLVLRFGRALRQPETPRRPVAEVFQCLLAKGHYQ